jgi:hypothetical protein
MKLLISTVVAGTGLALASAGTALAGCPDPGHQPPPKPVHHKPAWHDAYNSFVIPAGDACKATVTVTIRGLERDPYQVTRHGTTYTVLESKHETITVYNQENHRKVTKQNSGDFLVLDKGNDAVLYGKGNNTFFGAGVTGIVWTSGRQVAYVQNAQQPNQVLDIVQVHGKYVDLCRKVGSQGVEGKNPPATA